MKLLATSAALLTFSVHCPADEIACPNAIAKTVQTSPDVPKGWNAQQKMSKHPLIAFQINFGDPKKPDGAIYDERTVTRNESGDEIEKLSWNLSGMPDLYMVCGYFGTSVVLTRSIAAFSKCEVTSVKKRNAGRFEIKSTKCS